jgi:hypothetical protein
MAGAGRKYIYYRRKHIQIEITKNAKSLSNSISALINA